MIYIFRLIFGYVNFVYKNGFVEDFLTECFNNSIEIRDVQKCDDYIIASCNIKNYKKLHRIALKTGGVVKIIDKKGLPFVLLPLKNRYGFFVGMLLFCVLISFFGSFVWNVEINGNEKISNATVNAFLENNGLKQGVMWGSVNRDKIAWDMMSSFDDFSWVHINKRGTTALVEINEKTDTPPKDFDKLQGINVFRRELSVTVSREQSDVFVKNTKKYYNLEFFALSVPLYINRQKGEISSSSNSFLTIKDTALPIGYTVFEEQYLSSTKRTLNDNELKALSKKRLSKKELQELDGFSIVNKTEKYDINENSCTATFTYVIRRK